MTRNRQPWRGGRLEPGQIPPPAEIECHHGHVTVTTARDDQLVRCTTCQDGGEVTWLLVHRGDVAMRRKA